jgi:phosphohistidine phosphatase
VVTVRELILMRHAEAAPAARETEDFARPLTEAGRISAARAAKLLAVGAPIERVLYSPAARTSETASIIARTLSLEASALRAVPKLYLATAHLIGAALARWQGTARVILVVGHNPGISELGAELSPSHAGKMLQTAAYWRLPLDEAAWLALVTP